MDDRPNSSSVTVRYWAGARAAAGVESERFVAADVPDVGTLRHVVRDAHPGIGEVLERCSVLVDGLRGDDDAVVAAGALVEVLPPFVGG